MRRLLLFLALFALGVIPAAGKIIVVADSKITPSGTDQTMHSAIGQPRSEAMVLELLRRYGKPFDVIGSNWNPPGYLTYWISRGRMPVNPADTTQNIRSYTGALVLGWNGGGASNGKYATGYGMCRVDSMSLTSYDRLPYIPTMAMTFANCYGAGAVGPLNHTGIGKDSCGIDLRSTASGMRAVVPYYDNSGQSASAAFAGEAGLAGWTTGIAFVPAGGIRKLVMSRANNGGSITYNGGMPCQWCDSMGTASADTTIMFDRLNAHAAGAKPLSYALVGFGIGQADQDTSMDSGVGAGVASTTGQPTLIALMALAHLDSLTNGSVFDGAKLPIRVGVGIIGGFSRSGRNNFGGVDPSDVAALSATIDSLKSKGIPAVLLANIDSVATYASDKAMWAKWPQLRYAPYSRLGIDSTAAGLGTADSLHDVDVFGRWRSRKAYGPGTTADTSVYALLRRSFARCDSIFGRSASSRAVFPPDGDWSPYNAVRHNTGDPAPMIQDSIVYAIYNAGGACIVHDSQNAASDNNSAFNATANPRGYVRGQQMLRFRFDTLGTTAYGTMPLLGYSGRGLFAGRCQANSGAIGAAYILGSSTDTTSYHKLGPWPDAATYNPFVSWDHEISRITNSALAEPQPWSYPQWRGSSDTQQYDDITTPKADALYGVAPGSILLLCVNDLAGNDRGIATRNGWWTLKSLKNSFDIINRLAGRNIIQFDYPENIRP